MSDIFLDIFNMSLTASLLVIAVVILRFALKRAPKWIACLLWGMVALRLVFPFSLESSLSVVPSVKPVQMGAEQGAPVFRTGVPVVNDYLAERTAVTGESFVSMLDIASAVWAVGIICMLLYGTLSYLAVHRRVGASIACGDGVYLCDGIGTPFVLGIFPARIYLPSGMKEEQMEYVIKHERAHLARKDHLWKPLGFLLLCIYWFNPAIWVAYILLCRDIELACDEKAVKDMDDVAKRGYSETLVACSMRRRMIMACPLAFGEVGVKDRIVSVLSYKKPALWVICISLAACASAAICLLTDPAPIKLTQIEGAGDLSGMFDGASGISVNSRVRLHTEDNKTEDSVVTFTADAEAIERILGVLRLVEVERHPISGSRADDRDNTYNVVIDEYTIINFSEDLSEVWIDTGLKPSYSYRVIDSEPLKTLFELDSNATVTPDAVEVGGSDIEGVSISVVGLDLAAAVPYIEIEWRNDTDTEISFPESFTILRLTDGGSVSCAMGEPVFIEIANLLPAHSLYTKIYDISQFDISEAGDYRFTVPMSGNKTVWTSFTVIDTPNTSEGKPYVYTDPYGAGLDALTLYEENKTFNLSSSVSASSGYLHGTYTLTEHTLILNTDDGGETLAF